MHKRRTHARYTLHFATLLGVFAVACVLRIHAVSEAWSTNIQAKLAVEFQATEPSTPSTCGEIDPETPLTYAQVVACLRLARAEVGSDAVPRLMEYSKASFPDRYYLLIPSYAIWLHNSGLYEESCRLLLSLPAKSNILTLAIDSRDSGNWSALEEYVACLDKSRLLPGFVSPYEVALLNFGLAQHLEEIGELAGARASYEGAAAWYPTVWADPVLALARLELNETGVEQAIELLLASLQQATLPQSVFLLARQLAFYNEQAGDMAAAYCSYYLARESSRDLIEAYAPQAWQEGIRDRIAQLGSTFAGGAPNCEGYWSEYGIVP